MNPTSAQPRSHWLSHLERLALPPLEALAKRELKKRMPVEKKVSGPSEVTYLEAMGRLLTGIAPWLENKNLSDSGEFKEEEKLRTRFNDLALAAIDAGTDPASPDRMNFTSGPWGHQPLVDAAFLSHALLRAPKNLAGKLDPRVKKNLVAALLSSRAIVPGENNWLLFSAMVEAGLDLLGEKADLMRVRYAVSFHRDVYKGDGAYGDGRDFHWDYYNSFVMHPMMVDVAEHLSRGDEALAKWLPEIKKRARRYSEVLERMIAPDGSFAPIGRSLCYRGGAFQMLAMSALRRDLPETISPAQVRSALSAVLSRTMEAPGTFDENGWPRIGLAGHQPGLGEIYISTGSLYLCSAIFLPLGLSPADPFWSEPDADWTSKKIWAGIDQPCDHSIQN
ncbi:MAG: DUF2264 domain-containing protein [Spirochaetia bacterium]|nr:DUF2264 domain-containing protein [Spirochaetia bacterium]